MPTDMCSSVMGGNTRLECRVVGDPPPDIRWFKDGRDITHNHRYSFSRSQDGDVSVLIENISHRDEGHYRCRAENSEGFASTSAYLVVRGHREFPDDVLEQVHTMQVEQCFSFTGSDSTVHRHLKKTDKDDSEARQRRTFEQIVDEEKEFIRDGRYQANGKETPIKSQTSRHEGVADERSSSRRTISLEGSVETSVKGLQMTSDISSTKSISQQIASDACAAQTPPSTAPAGGDERISSLSEKPREDDRPSGESQVEIVFTAEESFSIRRSRSAKSAAARSEVSQSLSESQRVTVVEDVDRKDMQKAGISRVESDGAASVTTRDIQNLPSGEAKAEMYSRDAAANVQTDRSIAVPDVTDANISCRMPTRHMDTQVSSRVQTEDHGATQRATTKYLGMSEASSKTFEADQTEMAFASRAEDKDSGSSGTRSSPEAQRRFADGFESEETGLKTRGASPPLATGEAPLTSARSPERSQTEEAGSSDGVEYIPVACRLEPQRLEHREAEWGQESVTDLGPSSLVPDSGFADSSLMDSAQSEDNSVTDASAMLPTDAHIPSTANELEKKSSRSCADRDAGHSEARRSASQSLEGGHSEDQRVTDADVGSTVSVRRRRRREDKEEILDEESQSLLAPDTLGASDRETSQGEETSLRKAAPEADEISLRALPEESLQQATDEERGCAGREEQRWSRWVQEVTESKTVTMEGERKVTGPRTNEDLTDGHADADSGKSDGSKTSTLEHREEPDVQTDTEAFAEVRAAETETMENLGSSVDPVNLGSRGHGELFSPVLTGEEDSLGSAGTCVAETEEGSGEKPDLTHPALGIVGESESTRDQEVTDFAVAEASNLSESDQPGVEAEKELRKSEQQKSQSQPQGDKQQGDVAERGAEAVKVPDNEAPKVLSVPEDVKVKVGDTIRLVSQVTGNPLPEVKWFKEGDTVKAGERVTLQVADDIFTLEIREATERDGGTYTLTAHNSQGTIFSDVLVTVSIPLAMGPADQDLRVTASVKIPDIVAPSGEVIVREPGTLQLVCTIRGQPPPRVAWSKDGETLQADSRRRVYASQDQFYLEVPRVTLDDAGDYTCTASNSEGSVSCSIAVFVESQDSSVSAMDAGAAAMVPLSHRESSSDVSSPPGEAPITRHLKLVAAAAAFSLAAFGLKKIVESLPKGS